MRARKDYEGELLDAQTALGKEANSECEEVRSGKKKAGEDARRHVPPSTYFQSKWDEESGISYSVASNADQLSPVHGPFRISREAPQN